MKQKCFSFLFCSTLLVIIISPKKALAQSQGFINYSTYLGGSSSDNVITTKVVNGETYVLGITTSANFPVTNGSTYSGGDDGTITKLDTSGKIIYSTYIGGNGDDDFANMAIVNGEVFILGSSTSSNYPVTNGSAYGGGGDVVVTKLNTNGSIAFSTYIGGDDNESLDENDGALQIVNNELYVAGYTYSANFPIINSNIYHAANSNGDGFIVKLDSAGNIIFSTSLGGTAADGIDYMQVENNKIFIAGTTTSSDFPVTNGATAPNNVNCFAAILNTNGNILSSSYIGGDGQEILEQMEVENGNMYLNGMTTSTNFPVTNGSSKGNAVNGVFVTALNSNGNIIYSTYAGVDTNNVPQTAIPYDMEVSNGEVYLGVRHNFRNLSVNPIDVKIIKLNTSGDVVFSQDLPIGINSEPIIMQIANGETYLTGSTESSNYPVTNGSMYANAPTGYFTQLNTNGSIAYSTYLGTITSNDLQIIGGKVYIAGTANSATYPSTNGSTVLGDEDDVVIIINNDGTSFFTGYLGGTNAESNIGLQIDSSAVYISGETNSINYPVTDSSRYKNNNDIYITKLQFCPFNYDVTNDTLSPSIQTTCKLGVGTLITGRSIIIDSSNAAPVLYRNGIAQKQATEVTYQWQIANSISGPWSNIVSAIAKDYLPTGGSITEYYRRLAYSLPGCGTTVIDTSGIATVLINANTAPVVNTGNSFYICSGTSVTIGGGPTAIGGTAPYKFSWNTGIDSVSNPVVAPLISTLYTLTVTDTLGCTQIGQTLVNVYKAADAGPDENNCAGSSVRIGSAPIVNVPTAVYSWSPSAGLSDSTQAQPYANPTDSTLYTLSITLPESGGGFCTTSDSVNVVPVTAPTPNFAGPDRSICLGDSVTLGITAQSGYTYTWAPGNYLRNNNSAIVTFYAGNQVMPVPNPGVFTVTAQKEGCSFTDQTTVAVIESNAGLPGCGPRIVGSPDRTPDITETYIWDVASGPGNLTGATNLPQVPVSASTTDSTVYILRVFYGGRTCISTVTVPVCGGTGGSAECTLDTIYVAARYGCASYSVNGGNVSLTAPFSPGYTYTWSPTEGLSDSVGNTVNLIDNTPRTYTVTATNMYNPSDYCSRQVKVNDPAFSLPTFKAKDTVGCVGIPVNIGYATVAGYSYTWQGNDISDKTISNPTATINTLSTIDTSAQFPVTIIDTATGCFVMDTATINIQVVNANAGVDQTVCNNAIVTLGTPSEPGVTYLWYPPASPWQNGTDSSFAQPEVLVATNTSFIVKATSSIGCTKSDTTIITINSASTIPDAPDTIYCKGSTGVKIGSPALPGVNYLWSPSTGLSDPTAAQPVASPTATTTYTVVATFPGSCLNVASDQVTVTVSDPSFTLPDINYCPANGAVALGAAAPSGMLSYSWSPATLVSNNTIANPTTLTPPPTSPTTYTLTVTNGNGCTAKNTTTIYPMTNPPIAGIDRGMCLNSSTTLGSNTNDTSANITYSWSPATNLDNSTSITPVFTPTSTGTFTYTITKTDNSIGCSNSDTVTITVNDFSLPAISSPSICQNSCVQIGTTPAAGVTYSWSPVSGLSNVAIANPVACAGTTTETYTLTATSASGCSATANVLVIVNPIPAPLINIPTVTTCLGTSDVTFNPTITPAGTYTYLWSPNDGTLNNIYSDTPQVILTSTSNKQYSLTVTDSVTGCSSSATANLITNACSVLASVGDYVWFDLNNDGIQDANEAGVSGATVTLYNSLGFAVASSITDASGHYLINNVQPDTGYYIIFNRPSGYTFTLQNIGGITAVDNSKPDATGKTNSFDLSANENLTSIDAGVKSIGTVLPVTLVSFTENLQNNTVVLNWQTSAEFNNSYFNIERSTDGIHFVVIGKVMGNGTSSIPHSYVYTDTQPLDGTSFYRLVQVDYDGEGTYSDIIAITNNIIQQPVNAYYNSQINAILINFINLQTGNVQFNLFADDGQLIKSLSAENILTEQLNTQGLAKGIYLLQIAGNTVNYAQKIFVQ